MRRLFSPVRSDNKLYYTIEGDKITVVHHQTLPPTLDDNMYPVEQDPIVTQDVFDFTGMPNGVATVSEFETVLPLNPFISVKRVNGEIEIKVINYIGANATEAERFPVWEVL